MSIKRNRTGPPERACSVFARALPVWVIQIIFFRFSVLFGQDGHGLFQLALAAAALADEGPDGLGEVAAEDGVQPFPHGGHAIGPAGNGGGGRPRRPAAPAPRRGKGAGSAPGYRTWDRLLSKNTFTIVSDASILPESTPKRKSGKSSGHAVILYLFYRCLRICSCATNVCALCDFNADRNAASLCKDALVLRPSKPVYYGQIQNTNAAKVRAAFP